MVKIFFQNKFKALIDFYQEKNSLMLNIFFIAFFVVFQKPLLEAARLVINNGEQNIPYGVAILILLVLEVYAYLIKIKTFSVIPKLVNDLSVIIWIFHLVTGAIMVMFAYGAIAGGQITEASGDDYRFGLILFGEVIRNLILLGILGIKTHVPNLALVKKITADLVISLFNFLALLITWYALVSNMPALNSGGLGMTIFNTVLALIILFIFYLPLNLFNFIDFYSKPRTPNERLAYYVSWVVIICLLMSPLYN